MYKPLVLVNEVNEPLFFSAGQVKDTLDNGSKIGKDNYRWPVIYSKGSVKEPGKALEEGCIYSVVIIPSYDGVWVTFYILFCEFYGKFFCIYFKIPITQRFTKKTPSCTKLNAFISVISSVSSVGNILHAAVQFVAGLFYYFFYGFQ